jgi:hypothetical protein
MNLQLSPDLQSLLGEYFKYFVRLRPNVQYPGSIPLIKDYKKINNHIDADRFFEKYGVGNKIIVTENPLERTAAYELLLYILNSYEEKQFSKIHKGTPYYFIAWTAYQSSFFEKALFYMDAAVSEDLKIYEKRGKKTTPSMSFFLLEENKESVGFFTLDVNNSSIFTKTLREFSSNSKLEFKREDFIEMFVKPILFGDNKHRSLLTALYGFFLEYQIYERQVFLRSSDGGSIEPFLNHLLKGARILESILELKSGKMLNLYQKIAKLKSQIEITQKHFDSNGALKTLEHAKNSFNELSANGNTFQDCNFVPSYIIRNTTGHSLLWTDEFKTNQSYLILYQCLTNSILWSIYKLWISK